MFETAFLQILNLSITACYWIVFVCLIRFFLKKTYALWIVVFFRLICPFSFESLFALLPNNITPIPTNIGYMQNPQIDIGIPVINNLINPILPEATAIASINPMQTWLFIGQILWAIGVVGMLIYSLVSLRKLTQNLQNARFLKENIYLSHHIHTAFEFGIFRPKIYLPESLSETEQVYILLHEKTHIKRLDHIVKIIAFLILCLHWFNPFVWFAFFTLAKDMELSCDEAVIKTLGNDVKKDYASSLLRLNTGKRIVSGTPLAFGEGNTKNRVKHVLHYKKRSFWAILITTLVCTVAIFCIASNPIGTNIVNPSVRDYVVGEEGILGTVDTEKFTQASADFAIGADQYGRAVFKEPKKAFATFQTLYADALTLIATEKDLKPLSFKTIPAYKIYGFQIENPEGDAEMYARCVFVSHFLDIYENSFEKTPPNTNMPQPTMEDSSATNLPVYTDEWIENDYTATIPQPEQFKMYYYIDQIAQGSFSIFLSEMSMDDASAYIQQLNQVGYTTIASNESEVFTGVLLQNDKVSLSIAYSENIMGITIAFVS